MLPTSKIAYLKTLLSLSLKTFFLLMKTVPSYCTSTQWRITHYSNVSLHHTHTCFLTLVFFSCPSWGFSHSPLRIIQAISRTWYLAVTLIYCRVTLLSGHHSDYSSVFGYISYIIFFMTSVQPIALHSVVSALDFSLSMYIVLPYWN